MRAEWEAGLAEIVGEVDAALVTHRLGTITALRHLAVLEPDWRLGGFVAASGFFGLLAVLRELDDYLSGHPDAAALAPPRIAAHVMIVSDNDMIVPPAASRALAAEIAADSWRCPAAATSLPTRASQHCPMHWPPSRRSWTAPESDTRGP
jgi:uncharacterized protein